MGLKKHSTQAGTAELRFRVFLHHSQPSAFFVNHCTVVLASLSLQLEETGENSALVVRDV